MHPEWISFLETQGANFEDQDGVPCVASFDGPVADADARLFDLSPLGVLCLEGPDAAKFLQGYATCDMDLVNSNRSAAGALTTREGRTLATFRTWGAPDRLRLRLHRELIAPVQEHLGRYLTFSDADLLTPPRPAGLGLAGPDAPGILQELFGRAPDYNEVIRGMTPAGLPMAVIRLLGPMDRFELWTDVDAAREIWPLLAERAQPSPYSHWNFLRIQVGYTELSPRIAGEYIPQALNLQALGLVSFTKGCYLGQEIIARTQHLGRIKRRVYRYALGSGSSVCPALGADVMTDGDSPKAVGEVVSAASDGHRCEMLAVVRTDQAERPLFVEGEALEPLPLPYELEPATSAAAS